MSRTEKVRRHPDRGTCGSASGRIRQHAASQAQRLRDGIGGTRSRLLQDSANRDACTSVHDAVEIEILTLKEAASRRPCGDDGTLAGHRRLRSAIGLGHRFVAQDAQVLERVVDFVEGL